MPSPYRPHDSGHDYYGVGTYLITLVVIGRNPLLGRLVGDAVRPEVQLSEIGEMVRDAWLSIPAKAAEHGNQVRVLASVCMPDHFHGVIEVLAPKQWCHGGSHTRHLSWRIALQERMSGAGFSPHPYTERTYQCLLETRETTV